MKTIRVSEKAHSKLVAQAAYLTLSRGRKVSLSEALEHLLDKQEKEGV